MFSGKIFGVGFQKSGTKSLAEALRILGYRVCGPVGLRDPSIARNVYTRTLPLVERFDAFQDNPWPILYRFVDERFPGSKFVLTLRPPDAWIASVVRHFGGTSTPMREWIYGVGDPRGHEELYLERYEAHNRQIMEYFRDRNDDFLILRVTDGEGWTKLCPFLDAPVPEGGFPHANSVGQRRLNELRKTIWTVVSALGKPFADAWRHARRRL